MPLTAEQKSDANEPGGYLVDVGSHHIHLTEWHPARRGEGCTLLLLHATGFHARVWDEVVGLLPNQHILAWDMRGHGRSDKCQTYNWSAVRDDLVALLSQLNLERQPVVAGHSMGGWCAIATAIAAPASFRSIVLLDPVIMAPERFTAPQRHDAFTVANHPISKRRNHWRSWEEMYESFKNRQPFNRWTPTSLEAYCRHGLVADTNGDGFVLACPPQVEASFYVASADSCIDEGFEKVQSFVSVLRATPRTPEAEMMDFNSSPTWPELASRLPHAEDLLRPQLTHFMLMEQPMQIADHIRAHLTRAAKG